MDSLGTSPGSWGDLESEAFRSRELPVNFPAAAAGAIATIAPLAVGLVLRNHSLGLFCALGGLNTALVMGPTPRASRLSWGLFAAATGTVAVGVATLTCQPAWAAVIATVIWSFAWAMLRVVGPQGALVGFTTTAIFIIVNGLPGSPSQWWVRVAEYALGSASALALMMIPASTTGGSRQVVIPRSSFTQALGAGGIVRMHAFRVAVVAGLGTIIARAIDLSFGYWIPLTGVAVTQPDVRGSRVRSLQRAAGTLIGTAVVALVVVITRNEVALLGVICVSSGALFALKERGYFWLTMLLTPTALLMISTVQFYGWDIAVSRIVNTAVGLLLALMVAEVLRARVKRSHQSLD